MIEGENRGCWVIDSCEEVGGVTFVAVINLARVKVDHII